MLSARPQMRCSVYLQILDARKVPVIGTTHVKVESGVWKHMIPSLDLALALWTAARTSAKRESGI